MCFWFELYCRILLCTRSSLFSVCDVSLFCLVGKLMDLHGDGGAVKTSTTGDASTGQPVDRASGYEPPIQDVV